ncbi:hypothetical protein GCM10011385_19490 [Nitratireductor aestuarii]|uniref:Sialidase domain-containing protein n=1 Tax=Nitratireductor aestuarii TaxID=1735103 RepID=A0A916RSS4_9HYPH|nr:sialidase family protein [Nitratireductor aestuarii]GGA65718.1 hypothetical protein GCM10011385_19490 [Nitratireductor aestuarii]
MTGKQDQVKDAVHRVVYRNEEAFSSHPFLGGLWRVVNGDLVLAFMKADCTYVSGGDVNHDKITMSRRQMCAIRSGDNGATWDSENLVPIFETPEPAIAAEAPLDPEEPFDMDSADTIVAMGSSPALLVADAKPWMRISTDGGRSWRRPFKLPMNHFASLSGHGSFVRRQDGMWLAALSAASSDGWRRRALLYGSRDGADWNFLSWITPPVFDDEMDAPHTGTPRFWAHRYFYPRPICLRDGRILVSVRSQRDPTGALWTEIFESQDHGRTFHFLSRVNDWGAPGDLLELADGRIVCVYGYRLKPYGIRGRVSSDGGRTWDDEFILRDDGGSWDLGYPRVLELEPNRLLAVYYMNRADDPVQANGGVRHIAATEFSLPSDTAKGFSP